MQKKAIGILLTILLLALIPFGVQAQETSINEDIILSNGKITPSGASFKITPQMLENQSIVRKSSDDVPLPEQMNDYVFVEPPMVKGKSIGVTIKFINSDIKVNNYEDGHTLVMIGVGTSVAEYKKAKEIFSDFDKMSQQSFKQKYGEKIKGMSKGGVGDFSGKVFLYMYFAKDEQGNSRLIDGEIGFMIDTSYKYTYPLPAPVSFIYLKGKIGLGAKFSLGWENSSDGKTYYTGTISVTPRAEAGVGVGCWVAYVEGGFQGSLPVKFKFGDQVPPSFDKRLSVNFVAGGYAEARFIIFSKRWSQNWVECSLYPDHACGRAKSIVAKSGDEFQMISRDYLSSATSFAASVDEKALIRDGLSYKEVIKSSVMSISDTKLLSLGNGKEMLLWLDDDSDRSDINRSALFYAIRDNGEWRDPAIIFDDGTLDYDFDAVYKNGKVYIVWLNLSNLVADNSNMQNVATQANVVQTTYDVEKDTFSELKTISSTESGLESRPILALSDTDEKASVSWLLNDAGDYETEQGTNKLLVSEFNGSSWSETPSVLYQTEFGFGSYDMAYLNGQRTIVFSRVNGTNGEEGNAIDDKYDLFRIDGNKTAIQLTNDKSNNTYPLIRAENNTMALYWQSDAGLNRQDISSTSAQPEVISAEANAIRGFDVLGQDDDRVIIWENPDGWTTNVSAVFRDPGEWGAPVVVVEGEEGSLNGLSTFITEQGALHLSGLTAEVVAKDFLTDGINTNEPFYGNYDLIYATIDPKTYSVEFVGDIYHDPDEIANSADLPLIVTITNTSNQPLEKVRLTIKDQNGTTLLEDFYPTDLASGETGTINVNFPLPANIQETTLQVNVQPATDKDALLQEFDNSNNSDDLVIGSAVLAIESMRATNDGNTVQIEVTVSNSGYDSSDPFDLTLYDSVNNTSLLSKKMPSIPAGQSQTLSLSVPANRFDFSNGTQDAVAYVEMETGGIDINSVSSFAALVPFVQGSQQAGHYFPLWFEEGMTLPQTGFSTRMPVLESLKPASISYGRTGASLEIPSADLYSDIVTMPKVGNGWADEWLGSEVGLMDTFDGFEGKINWIAGHNHLNQTEAGPFALLYSLDLGDRVFIRQEGGELQQFSVQMNKLYPADGFKEIISDLANESDGLVLLTCENEDVNGQYLNRRVVYASAN